MKLLRIKDNSQQKKDVFSQVAKLTGKIADKTLEQLEREGVFVFPETVKDAEDITQDQMILQSVNDTYRSGISNPDVIAKKRRGIHYCEVASRWGKANGYKQWKYLFIPSKQIMPNSSFMQLAKMFQTM